jgi:hypothetical protein
LKASSLSFTSLEVPQKSLLVTSTAVVLSFATHVEHFLHEVIPAKQNMENTTKKRRFRFFMEPNLFDDKYNTNFINIKEKKHLICHLPEKNNYFWGSQYS